jgi:putative phage-type endonuclease
MIKTVQTQGSAEWHAFRNKGIGSSDIAAIVGLSPWKNIYEVWLEKTGRQEELPPTAPMLRGIELEPIARKAYIELTGNPVIQGVMQSKDFDFFIASLDGINLEGDLIVEIKCPTSKKTLQLAAMGQIEDHYKCQVQWQLMVSGAKKCHFFVWHEDTTEMIEVLPDLYFQQSLIDAALKFWDLVVDDIEPEKTEDKYIEINDASFIEASNAWKGDLIEMKVWQEREKLSKERMLACTDGGNCKGNGIKISLVETETIDWKAICKAYNITDEMIKPFKKEKKVYQRPLLIKEKK